jgi:hypothetical protein
MPSSNLAHTTPVRARCIHRSQVRYGLGRALELLAHILDLIDESLDRLRGRDPVKLRSSNVPWTCQTAHRSSASQQHGAALVWYARRPAYKRFRIGVTPTDARALQVQIDEPGASELAGLLDGLVAGDQLQRIHKLKAGVYRLSFGREDGCRSFVAKRLQPDRAERNRLVAERWLPAVGLDRHGPSLAGAVASPGVRCIWQVYEDLGPYTLEDRIDPPHVRAATSVLARLHSAFAEHPLLAECRLWGEDHGSAFYRSSVCDAVTALEALPSFDLDREQSRLRDRLLVRLYGLGETTAERTALLVRAGGAETLLHGDLWPRNMFVLPRGEELLVRLIDWDHVGVGSVAYDLSIFLLRFPLEERKQVLDAYADAGGRLPANDDLNALCETAELARLANRVIWPALAAREKPAPWAFEELALVEQWFEAFDTPVLT